MTDITRKSVLAHFKERERYDDSIAAYARELAKSIPGNKITDSHAFDGWDLWDETISARFEESWQGGEDIQFISFPASILDDPEARQAFIDKKTAEYEQEQDAKAERERAADQRELERLQAKLRESEK